MLFCVVELMSSLDLRSVFAVLLCVLTSIGSGGGRAAHDLDAAQTNTGARLELLVFESENCAYCEVFRRDVAPSYRFAPLSATAPLRFVDIAKVDLDRIGLASKLNMLPTTVLMKNGREVERIPGLTGADTYYMLLKYMIAKNE